MMRRRRMMSSRHRISTSQLFSLFGVLMTKGEKRVIFISVFFSLVCVVCNMEKNLFMCGL
jgi:hypothetical protein